MEYTLREKNIAYISRNAIRENYRAIESILRSAARPIETIATVKADAYGHGVDTVTEELGSMGCRNFAVSSEKEAITVRQLEEGRGRHPRILILGYTFPENAPTLAAHDIACTAVSPEHALALAEGVGQGKLKIHIKLDTGMHRVGFSCDTPERTDETVSAIARLSQNEHLIIDGIFSHFACCDDERLDGLSPVSEVDMTGVQLARYRLVVTALEQRGVSVGLRHLANSAAILACPQAWEDPLFDAVRAGIILYGLSPDGRPWQNDTFHPVMTLQTTVVHIQTLLPGEHVSYGATYTADSPRTLVTLPIGYGDGWIRAYRGAMVSIHGRAYPIVGRICMDQCMVDITGDEDRIQVGDTVVLFGDDRGEKLFALAKKADTIVYECTCQVSKRVPRRAI